MTNPDTSDDRSDDNPNNLNDPNNHLVRTADLLKKYLPPKLEQVYLNGY